MLCGRLWRTIIYWHVPRRGPFDKTSYIDTHIEWTYKRTPKQAKWDDPNYDWPPTVPKYTQHKGRHLIHEIEQEYMNQNKPKFEVPEFRTGDELQIENFYSISSQKFSTFKGVCIAKKNWKNLHASFNIMGSANNMAIEMSMKLYSPLLKSVKVLDHGSGNLRARLNYFRNLGIMKFPAVKKGRGWRARVTNVAKVETKQKRLRLLQEDAVPPE